MLAEVPDILQFKVLYGFLPVTSRICGSSDFRKISASFLTVFFGKYPGFSSVFLSGKIRFYFVPYGMRESDTL